jgi:hypothetical protein
MDGRHVDVGGVVVSLQLVPQACETSRVEPITVTKVPVSNCDRTLTTELHCALLRLTLTKANKSRLARRIIAKPPYAHKTTHTRHLYHVSFIPLNHPRTKLGTGDPVRSEVHVNEFFQFGDGWREYGEIVSDPRVVHKDGGGDALEVLFDLERGGMDGFGGGDVAPTIQGDIYNTT